MKLKELKDKLDISKSDYNINKNVFRITLALIGLLVITILSIDGFGVMFGQSFACCPIDAQGGYCTNPMIGGIDIVCHEYQVGDVYCIESNNIPAGECVGDVPSDLAQNFKGIVFLLLLAAFLFNHLKYNKDYKVKRK